MEISLAPNIVVDPNVSVHKVCRPLVPDSASGSNRNKVI